jgi:hypothetical protein
VPPTEWWLFVHTGDPRLLHMVRSVLCKVLKVCPNTQRGTMLELLLDSRKIGERPAASCTLVNALKSRKKQASHRLRMSKSGARIWSLCDLHVINCHSACACDRQSRGRMGLEAELATLALAVHSGVPGESVLLTPMRDR